MAKKQITKAQVLSFKKKKILLAWWILEQKLKYYHPEFGQCVSDEKYDKNEDTYKKLCKMFKEEPTACNHVGFPWETPSGRLVASKFDAKSRKKVLEGIKASNNQT